MLASRSALALLAVPVLALALAACGDDGGQTTTVTETVPTEAPPPEPAPPPPPPEPAPEGDTGPARFQSPSGNIGCALTDEGVRCDIAERDWQPPAPKQPCELDYGQGIGLDSSGAAFVCAGDTALGAGKTLPYGSLARRGSFECESGEAGMSCTDAATGAGFLLSRERYDLRGPSS